MAREQVQKRRAKARTSENEVDETRSGSNGAELDEGVEAALDSIDEALADLDELMGTEEEARGMVAGFVQEGGE